MKESNERKDIIPNLSLLYFATALIALVSLYTTFEGMNLFLRTDMALVASSGVQISLYAVAWSIRLAKRYILGLLVIYILTAIVSIGFSYINFYNTFSREIKPFEIRRAAFDSTISIYARIDEQLLLSKGNALLIDSALTKYQLDELKGNSPIISGKIANHLYVKKVLSGASEIIKEWELKHNKKYQPGPGKGPLYNYISNKLQEVRIRSNELNVTMSSIHSLRNQLNPNSNATSNFKILAEAYGKIPWGIVKEFIGENIYKPLTLPSIEKFTEQFSSKQEEFSKFVIEAYTNFTGSKIIALILATILDLLIFIIAYAGRPSYFDKLSSKNKVPSFNEMRRIIRDISSGVAPIDSPNSPDSKKFINQFLKKVKNTIVYENDLTHGEKLFIQDVINHNCAKRLPENEKSNIIILDETFFHALLMENQV